MKGAVNQEEITTVNIYISNISASSFIKQTLLVIKAQRDAMIVGDFNTPL
jgi:hypothetical protein